MRDGGVQPFSISKINDLQTNNPSSMGWKSGQLCCSSLKIKINDCTLIDKKTRRGRNDEILRTGRPESQRRNTAGEQYLPSLANERGRERGGRGSGGEGPVRKGMPGQGIGAMDGIAVRRTPRTAYRLPLNRRARTTCTMHHGRPVDMGWLSADRVRQTAPHARARRKGRSAAAVGPVLDAETQFRPSGHGPNR